MRYRTFRNLGLPVGSGFVTIEGTTAEILPPSCWPTLRMPFTHGHSRAVAELAEAAGEKLGMPSTDVRALRWSGLVHDLGELAVPVST